MAILPIKLNPDPVLRRKAKKVSSPDGSIQRLVDNMLETVKSANGVGLAAPQIGTSLRVIVICPTEEEKIVLINPEIVRASGERVVNEGCLSIPGYIGQVKRAQSVTAKGRDRNWKEIRLKADELLAQAIEHEIDHLNGVLYIDRLESPEDLYRLEPEEPPPSQS